MGGKVACADIEPTAVIQELNRIICKITSEKKLSVAFFFLVQMKQTSIG